MIQLAKSLSPSPSPYRPLNKLLDDNSTRIELDCRQVSLSLYLYKNTSHCGKQNAKTKDTLAEIAFIYLRS
jgi:hypothetical protein